MNIHIGNLSYDTTEDQLRKVFGDFGEVMSVNIVIDQHSGRPRGFAFVEMSKEADASAAIRGLDGHGLNGRLLNVNEAKPRSDNGNRDGGNRYRKVY
jgi:RNA recognition motif-containing protein